MGKTRHLDHYHEEAEEALKEVKTKMAKKESYQVEQGDPEDEEEVCRICLSNEEPENLFRPCKCKGTMKWVHVSCLNTWRTSSANPKAYYRCDQCHYRYRLGHVFDGDTLLLARFLGSRFAIEVLSLFLLALLVFMGGFILKMWLLYQDSSDVITTWRQVWRVNRDHFMWGSALIGGTSLVGFLLSLLGSFLNPGGRMLRGWAMGPNWDLGGGGGGGGGGSGGGCGCSKIFGKKGCGKDAGAIILVLLIVVGLFIALWWIHDKVKNLSTKWLQKSVQIVLSVSEDEE